MPRGQRCRTRTTLSSEAYTVTWAARKRKLMRPRTRAKVPYSLLVLRRECSTRRPPTYCRTVQPTAPTIAPGCMSRHGICFGVSSLKATRKRPMFTTSETTTAPTTAHAP